MNQRTTPRWAISCSLVALHCIKVLTTDIVDARAKERTEGVGLVMPEQKQQMCEI